MCQRAQDKLARAYEVIDVELEVAKRVFLLQSHNYKTRLPYWVLPLHFVPFDLIASFSRLWLLTDIRAS